MLKDQRPSPKQVKEELAVLKDPDTLHAKKRELLYSTMKYYLVLYEPVNIFNIPEVVARTKKEVFDRITGKERGYKGLGPFDAYITHLGLLELNKIGFKWTKKEREKPKDLKHFKLCSKSRPRHSMKISVFKDDLEELDFIRCYYDITRSNMIGWTYVLGLNKFLGKANDAIFRLVLELKNRFIKYITMFEERIKTKDDKRI